MVSFGDSGFDATAEENQRKSSVIPAGEYRAVMTHSEKKATNDGTGHYLKTQWQIVSGEFQNRVIFQNFNLWLPPQKEQAVQIARGQMSELCRAVGVLTPRDSSELHAKVCVIKVKVRKDKSGQYDDQNEIVGYKPDQASQTVAAAPVAAGSTTPSVWG